MIREVTLEEISHMALEAKDSLWEQASEYDRDPKIYLHWTAGHYGQYYLNEYHIAIDADGSIYVDHDFDEHLSHTYMRNTGAIGVTLPCAVGSGSSTLGPEPPTAEQIEGMARVIAALAYSLGIRVDKQHVLTHGEAANNEDGLRPHTCYAWWNDEEGDGDTRGDLEYLGTDESPEYNPYAYDGSRGGDVLRGKANWYLNQWKKA